MEGKRKYIDSVDGPMGAKDQIKAEYPKWPQKPIGDKRLLRLQEKNPTDYAKELEEKLEKKENEKQEYLQKNFNDSKLDTEKSIRVYNVKAAQLQEEKNAKVQQLNEHQFSKSTTKDKKLRAQHMADLDVEFTEKETSLEVYKTGGWAVQQEELQDTIKLLKKTLGQAEEPVVPEVVENEEVVEKEEVEEEKVVEKEEEEEEGEEEEEEGEEEGEEEEEEVQEEEVQEEVPASEQKSKISITDEIKKLNEQCKTVFDLLKFKTTTGLWTWIINKKAAKEIVVGIWKSVIEFINNNNDVSQSTAKIDLILKQNLFDSETVNLMMYGEIGSWAAANIIMNDKTQSESFLIMDDHRTKFEFLRKKIRTIDEALQKITATKLANCVQLWAEIQNDDFLKLRVNLALKTIWEFSVLEQTANFISFFDSTMKAFHENWKQLITDIDNLNDSDKFEDIFFQSQSDMEDDSTIEAHTVNVRWCDKKAMNDFFKYLQGYFLRYDATWQQFTDIAHTDQNIRSLYTQRGHYIIINIFCQSMQLTQQNWINGYQSDHQWLEAQYKKLRYCQEELSDKNERYMEANERDSPQDILEKLKKNISELETRQATLQSNIKTVKDTHENYWKAINTQLQSFFINNLTKRDNRMKSQDVSSKIFDITNNQSHNKQKSTILEMTISTMTPQYRKGIENAFEGGTEKWQKKLNTLRTLDAERLFESFWKDTNKNLIKYNPNKKGPQDWELYNYRTNCNPEYQGTHTAKILSLQGFKKVCAFAEMLKEFPEDIRFDKFDQMQKRLEKENRHHHKPGETHIAMVFGKFLSLQICLQATDTKWWLHDNTYACGALLSGGARNLLEEDPNLFRLHVDVSIVTNGYTDIFAKDHKDDHPYLDLFIKFFLANGDMMWDEHKKNSCSTWYDVKKYYLDFYKTRTEMRRELMQIPIAWKPGFSIDPKNDQETFKSLEKFAVKFKKIDDRLYYGILSMHKRVFNTATKKYYFQNELKERKPDVYETIGWYWGNIRQEQAILQYKEETNRTKRDPFFELSADQRQKWLDKVERKVQKFVNSLTQQEIICLRHAYNFYCEQEERRWADESAKKPKKVIEDVIHNSSEIDQQSKSKTTMYEVEGFNTDDSKDKDNVTEESLRKAEEEDQKFKDIRTKRDDAHKKLIEIEPTKQEIHEVEEYEKAVWEKVSRFHPAPPPNQRIIDLKRKIENWKEKPSKTEIKQAKDPKSDNASQEMIDLRKKIKIWENKQAIEAECKVTEAELMKRRAELYQELQAKKDPRRYKPDMQAALVKQEIVDAKSVENHTFEQAEKLWIEIDYYFQDFESFTKAVLEGNWDMDKDGRTWNEPANNELEGEMFRNYEFIQYISDDTSDLKDLDGSISEARGSSAKRFFDATDKVWNKETSEYMELAVPPGINKIPKDISSQTVLKRAQVIRDRQVGSVVLKAIDGPTKNLIRDKFWELLILHYIADVNWRESDVEIRTLSKFLYDKEHKTQKAIDQISTNDLKKMLFEVFNLTGYSPVDTLKEDYKYYSELAENYKKWKTESDSKKRQIQNQIRIAIEESKNASNVQDYLDHNPKVQGGRTRGRSDTRGPGKSGGGGGGRGGNEGLDEANEAIREHQQGGGYTDDVDNHQGDNNSGNKRSSSMDRIEKAWGGGKARQGAGKASASKY